MIPNLSVSLKRDYPVQKKGGWELRMSSSRKEMLRLLADFGNIGMTMVASIFIGLGIGYWLDHKVFNNRTSPWLTLIFLGFGIAAGFKNLFLLARRKDFK
jgi:F0F1-type ATP synthase assembly protein I